MDVDRQSLFGLHVTWCVQLYSLAETPQLPPPAIEVFGLVYEGAIGQQRWRIFVTLCYCPTGQTIRSYVLCFPLTNWRHKNAR
jgi:hypothetical protein